MGYENKLPKGKVDTSYIGDLPTEALVDRAISKAVCEIYGVKVAFDRKRNITDHYYPYLKDGQICGYKHRRLPKEFTAEGNLKDVELFGQHLFTGSGRYLVITEGEIDCLSVAEAFVQEYDEIYPVVSVPNGAKASIRAIAKNRSWIRGYDNVIVLFDNDEPGIEGGRAIADAVGVDRAYIGSLGRWKDANEALVNGDYKRICKAVFNAKKYSPVGIAAGEKIWEQYKYKSNSPSSPYPSCFEGLNELLEGKRNNEIVLFISGTGCGKTTIFKEIILDELSLVKERPPEMGKPVIGIISLEESVGKTATDLMRMYYGHDLAKLGPKKERRLFDELFGDDKVMILDHHGSCSDESLVGKMETLCLLGCNILMLDHITIAVSEGNEGQDGLAGTDKLMSDLLKLSQKYPVWIGVVSHLRKAGVGQKAFEEGRVPSLDDIKGSGSIKQISFDIVAASRDTTAESEIERNTLKLTVLKARHTGKTGPAGSVFFNTERRRFEGGSFEQQSVLV